MTLYSTRWDPRIVDTAPPLPPPTPWDWGPDEQWHTRARRRLAVELRTALAFLGMLVAAV